MIRYVALVEQTVSDEVKFDIRMLDAIVSCLASCHLQLHTQDPSHGDYREDRSSVDSLPKCSTRLHGALAALLRSMRGFAM